MFISVVSELQNLPSLIQLDILKSKLCKTQIEIEFVRSTTNYMKIEIVKTEENYKFTYFGVTKEFDLLQDGFDYVICQFLGYRRVFLYGFTVKNEQGNKIKPKIPIYIRHKIGIEFTEDFKYIKGEYECENTQDSRFETDSVILKSLLENTCMYFVGNQQICKVWNNNGQLTLSIKLAQNTYQQRTLDFITKKPQINETIKILKKLDPSLDRNKLVSFMNQLWGKIDIKNAFDKSETNIFYALVEKVPSGHVKIDQFIKAVQKFFYTRNFYQKHFKGDFTEFVELMVPVRKPEKSIGNFFKNQNL